MKTKTTSVLLIGGVIITVIAYGLILLVLTLYTDSFSFEKAGIFGDSFGALSSLFSGLAFVGLIITIMLQKNELSFQRDELKLQRIALCNQTKELSNMSHFSSLEQVRAMLDAALERLSNSEGPTTKPEHFMMSSMPGEEWKTLLESIEPDEIIEAQQEYLKKHGPAQVFITSFATAAKFYLRSVNNDSVDFSLDDKQFLFINSCWLKDVPYLSTYLDNVVQYCELYMNYEPAHKMFLLSGLVAAQKLFESDEIIKTGAIEELIDYLEARDLRLPAIARQHYSQF